MFAAVLTDAVLSSVRRSIFPKLKFRLNGLQMNETYTVVLEMCLAVKRRFRFSNSRWVDAGEADPQFDEHRTCVVTVQPGKNCTYADVDLRSAKLSNNAVVGRGLVSRSRERACMAPAPGRRSSRGATVP